MVVKHNLYAMNSNRMLNITVSSQSKSTEKLSSGYRINRAADDAAGLSISEKMRKQIRGLTQASSNAQDGISMVQTVDGALEEVHSMLQRGNELAVKAANGTLSDDDRKYIENEIDELKTEIDRVRTTSKFNETYLFPESGSISVGGSTGVDAGAVYHVEYNVASGEFTSIGGATSSPDVSYVDSTGTAVTSSALAKKIAEEYIPNAINQILTTFPELKPSSAISVDVEVGQIDGKGSTLAYASAKIGDTAYDFTVKVDSDDFDDDDANGTGENSAVLESTIAHELMHTVMQNKYPKGMKTTFPDWFKEGVAQLAGGGFTTGWNDWISGKTADEIKTVLSDSNYSIENRPYGTGYLFAAYIAQLEGTSGDPAIAANVTGDVMTTGLKSIFSKLNSDSNQDIMNLTIGSTGKTVAQLKSEWDRGTNLDTISKFVYYLHDKVTASGTAAEGAGSLITSPKLSAGGTSILASTAKNDDQLVKVNQVTSLADGDVTGMAAAKIHLHVGADATSNNQIRVYLYNISSEALGLDTADFGNQDGARKSIDTFSIAIQRVSAIRSYYGSIQNRLDHTINNLDNVVENTTSAESSIRDTDMATEMVGYSNNNILAQAGQAMLAQSNQSNQGVLSLLQ